MNSRPNNKKFLARFLVLAAVLGALFFARAAPERAERAGLLLGKPVLAALQNISSGAGKTLALVSSKARLAEERRELSEELRAARLALFDRNMLARENRELKAFLGRTGRENGENAFLLASVISRPPIFSHGAILIDLGGKDGAREGALVFASESVVLGEIETVYENSSVARLFSSSGVSVPGFLEGAGPAFEVLGRGGGNYEAKIPKGIEIPENGIVSLERASGSVLGVLGSVEEKPEDSFLVLRFRSPANISALRRVFVERRAGA